MKGWRCSKSVLHFFSHGIAIHAVHWKLTGRMVVAVLLLCVCVILLLHHGYSHFFEEEPSHARRESCLCVCYFQPKDICHFESLSMVFLTCSFSVGLISDVRGEGNGSLSVIAVSLCVIGALLMLIGCIRFDGDRMMGFNFHNICNHETWIVVCFVNACIWLPVAI